MNILLHLGFQLDDGAEGKVLDAALGVADFLEEAFQFRLAARGFLDVHKARDFQLIVRQAVLFFGGCAVSIPKDANVDVRLAHTIEVSGLRGFGMRAHILE